MIATSFLERGVEASIVTDQRIPLESMTAQQLRGYREWKRTIPSSLRSLVESAMLGKNIRLDINDLAQKGLARLMRRIQEAYRTGV